MPKVADMPIRQEKALSSDFHMAMLRELEEHHDEHSSDWSAIPPVQMVASAQRRVYGLLAEHRVGIAIDPKQLVHAANELSIAWAILQVQNVDIQQGDT